MKVTRVIEYEGTPADIERHLKFTLLSAASVVRSGDTVPGIGLVMAIKGAPEVTIRLVSERTEYQPGDVIPPPRP